ncbi:MAG TPA: hypothetical protein VG165_12625 [Solirubrobacteraceae bacterium]|jgi:hypothetical protein|nr:hypothetical protein [Solirubrobacteraceae bacterium]
MPASDALRDQLGAPLPDCLGKLDDRELADLAGAMAEARAQQAIDVEAAIAEALRRLPPVLRGAARVILRG